MASTHSGIRRDRKYKRTLLCDHPHTRTAMDLLTASTVVTCMYCGSMHRVKPYDAPSIPPLYRTSFPGFKLI